jgi:hypothetical protein
MSRDRKTFLDATGQANLVYGAIAVILFGALWIWRVDKRQFDGYWMVPAILAGPILTFGPLVVLFVRIRCPRCRSRLLWRAARSESAGSFLTGILVATECPVCRYNGRADASSNRGTKAHADS